MLVEIQIIKETIKGLPTYMRMGKRAQKDTNQVGVKIKKIKPEVKGQRGTVFLEAGGCSP
jgi:glucose-6-phosphate 1-dehydrogenase